MLIFITRISKNILCYQLFLVSKVYHLSECGIDTMQCFFRISMIATVSTKSYVSDMNLTKDPKNFKKRTVPLYTDPERLFIRLKNGHLQDGGSLDDKIFDWGHSFYYKLCIVSNTITSSLSNICEYRSKIVCCVSPLTFSITGKGTLFFIKF